VVADVEETDDAGIGDTPISLVPDPGGMAQDPESVIGEPRPTMPVSTAKTAAKGRAVTAAVRKDIRAKLAFMMGLTTTMWAVSDQYCGAAAAAIVPELSEAITDIVVDSADLVAWFTAGGSYMKWLTLLTIVQPVGVTMWQHHISHTIGDTDDEPREQFDPQLYPATA
jgi:hypothetical protein